MNDKKIWPEILKSIEADVPDYKVVVKEDQALMKIIGVPLSIISPSFAEFSTTLGSTTNMPRDKFGTRWSLLGHEGLHARQNKKWGWMYKISYLPLLLSPLALGALGAHWSRWCLLFLAFLVTLLPLPNPFRVHWERGAYIMSGCLDALSGTKITAPDYVDMMVAHYTTGQYYWMCWSKSKARAFVLADMTLAQRIVDGTEVLEPYTSTVKIALAADKS
jgi:hypothetical protein